MTDTDRSRAGRDLLDDLARLATGGPREETFRARLRSDLAGEAAHLEQRRQPQSAYRGRHLHRGRRLAWAAAAAVIVVAAAAFSLTSALHDTAPAAAAVSFSKSDGYIVASVEDPNAAATQLRAAFVAHGLDIDLKLIPASPSVVGTVVFFDGPSGGPQIEPLASSTRQSPGGMATVGLRIPENFKGHASIYLGRSARPGEIYLSAGDAFAPGEALYKSGIQGMQVAAAAKVVSGLGLTVEWRDDHDLDAQPQAIPDNWVSGAVPLAPGKMLIFTSKEKPALPGGASAAPREGKRLTRKQPGTASQGGTRD